MVRENAAMGPDQQSTAAPSLSMIVAMDWLTGLQARVPTK
jgi:hypothetical protein